MFPRLNYRNARFRQTVPKPEGSEASSISKFVRKLYVFSMLRMCMQIFDDVRLFSHGCLRRPTESRIEPYYRQFATLKILQRGRNTEIGF